MAQFTKAAKKSEIPKGTGKVVEVDGKTVAVLNCGGTFYAIDNACPHRGGPLGEGTLTGTTVSCPWHGWEYDVKTGGCLLNPAVSVPAYEVKVEGEDVLVAV